MEEPSVVLQLKQRASVRGLNLEQYMQKEVWDGGVFDHWAGNPKGFKFVCNSFEKLNLGLANLKGSFAPDSTLGQRFQDGASWREVGQADGLHIIVFKYRYAEKLKTKVCYVNVHLDSISPVGGVDSETGKATYEPGETINHFLKDKKHKPYFTDLKKRQIGIRF
jgi:hypothetical protein